jgi:hypothetical protein
MFWIVVLLTIAILVTLALLADRSKDRRLRAAQSGSFRVESTKGRHAPVLVKQYANAGWTVMDQTTAKSLLSRTPVTITFVKQ